MVKTVPAPATLSQKEKERCRLYLSEGFECALLQSLTSLVQGRSSTRHKVFAGSVWSICWLGREYSLTRLGLFAYSAQGIRKLGTDSARSIHWFGWLDRWLHPAICEAMHAPPCMNGGFGNRIARIVSENEWVWLKMQLWVNNGGVVKAWTEYELIVQILAATVTGTGTGTVQIWIGSSNVNVGMNMYECMSVRTNMSWECDCDYEYKNEVTVRVCVNMTVQVCNTYWW